MASFPSSPRSSFRFDPFGSGSETSPPSVTSFSAINQRSGEVETYHLRTDLSQRFLPSHQPRSLSGILNYNCPDMWTYNPDIGLIHAGGCSVCETYKEHVTMAKNNQDTSLADALKLRRESWDQCFMDGYRLGLSRHTEKHRNIIDMTPQLTSTRIALDPMMDERQSLRRDLERARQHNKIHEDGLRAFSSDQTSPILNTIDRVPFSHACSTGSRIPSTTSFVEYHARGITSTSRGSRTVEAETPWERPSQVGELSKQPVATYASVASTRVSQKYPQTSQARLSFDSRTPSSPSTSSRPVTVVLRRNKQNQYIFPKTMDELKEVIALAGEPTPEGAAALTLIKKMCLHAHATPRDAKTPLQKWVLINWRNPYAPVNANVSSDGVKPNPRMEDPVDMWFEYLCLHSHSWPKGVRKDAEGRPVMSDLIANRAVARMRPQESASQRNDFLAQVSDMFSSPGMYRRLLEKHGYAVASQVTYKEFTGPITVERVALHFARSGITPSDATNKFEPWAKHYKEC